MCDLLVSILFIPYNFEKTLKTAKKKVQGLQAFAFPAVTVNDEHAKSRLKRKLRG